LPLRGQPAGDTRRKKNGRDGHTGSRSHFNTSTGDCRSKRGLYQ